MPWTADDARHKTGFANTPALQKQWAAVANKELASHQDDGRAIRTANAVVHRAYRGKPESKD